MPLSFAFDHVVPMSTTCHDFPATLCITIDEGKLVDIKRVAAIINFKSLQFQPSRIAHEAATSPSSRVAG